jgi:hypothetical protein
MQIVESTYLNYNILLQNNHKNNHLFSSFTIIEITIYGYLVKDKLEKCQLTMAGSAISLSYAQKMTKYLLESILDKVLLLVTPKDNLNISTLIATSDGKDKLIKDK